MIRSERLELIPATTDQLSAALESPSALGSALNARVPPTWPPEFLDPPALEFTRDRLAATATARRLPTSIGISAEQGSEPAEQ